MSVTSAPKALKTSANSQPTAPAPTMTTDLGAASRKSASSVEITVVLSSSRPICGMPFTRVPVATMSALDAVYVSLSTFTLRPFCSAPVPAITVTLCFFIRNSTPFEFCSLTLRECWMAAWKSSDTCPAFTPSVLASFCTRLAT